MSNIERTYTLLVHWNICFNVWGRYVHALKFCSKIKFSFSRYQVVLNSTLFILCCFNPKEASGQYTTTICQTHTDALIGPDRNAWAHANQAIVNESYLHNFGPPDLPCGINAPNITSLVFEVQLLTINYAPVCDGIPIFGNVYLNCPLTSSSVCPIAQDVLSPGCNFGVGANSSGTYSLDILNCVGSPAYDQSIAIDIVPSTHSLSACPSNGMGLSTGLASVTYNICVEFTYDQDVFDCSNTFVLPCDDNNDCTINDMKTVEACDINIVCVPCQGTVIDCDNGSTSVVPCDDGDPNTINDVQTFLDCDGSICVPCTGISCTGLSIINPPVQPLSCESLDFGVVLQGEPSSQGNDLSFQWSFENSTISVMRTIEVFQEGVYQLKVTDNTTGCVDSSSYDIVIPVVEIEAVVDVEEDGCEGDRIITIQSVTGGEMPYFYSLNGVDFIPEAEFSDLMSGSYQVVIMDVNGCKAFYDVTIDPVENIFLNAGPDQTIVAGDSVLLALQTNIDVASIKWDPAYNLSCPNCPSPYAHPSRTTNYIVTILAMNGCEYTDEVIINVEEEPLPIFIPNAFSPNQDGVNDVLQVFPGPDVQRLITFKIFDRWGALVFELEDFQSTDTALMWDGTSRGERLKAGVYTYFLEIELKDGAKKTLKGGVSIMR